MIEISENCLDKVTIELDGGPIRVGRCLCIGPIENPAENDHLNTAFSNIFMDENAVIDEASMIALKDGRTYRSFLFGKRYEGFAAIDFAEFKLEHEKMLLLANVFCQEDKKAIIRFGCLCRLKAWINGELVMNSHLNKNDNYIILYNLRKGNNLIVAELSKYTRPPVSFSIRINEYEDDTDGIEGVLLQDYLEYVERNKAVVLHENWNNQDRRFYEFIIIPRDFTSVKKDKEMTVAVKAMDGTLLDEFGAKMGTRIKYNLQPIREKYDNHEIVCFEAFFQSDKGYEKVVSCIKAADTEGIISSLRNEYKLIEAVCTLEEGDRINTEERLKKLEIANALAFRETYWEIKELFGYFRRGRHFRNYLFHKKYAAVYYMSDLDQTREVYNIALPENYSEEVKHPVIIYLHTGRYSWYSKYFYEAYEERSAIMVDITLRGYTMGSYIGEASFFEGLGIVMKNYSVDEDRIYIMGYTNGAYAAWTLAQSYPHLFAGIVAISGVPILGNVINLTNMNILNICGDKDFQYEKGYKQPEDILKEKSLACYKGIIQKEADDNTVYWSSYSKYVADWLLQYKRNKYPRKVCYRTERIRHNKGYWIIINGIEQGKKYGQVEGEVRDASCIDLTLSNVTGVTITVPDDMESKISVSINDRNAYTFENIAGREISFRKAGEDFIPAEEVLPPGMVNSSKGLGILDIYLDSLRIVIPSTYDSEEEKTVVEELAEKLAHPVNQGWNPNIFVDYPIIPENSLGAEDMEKSSIIVVSANKCTPLMERLKGHIPIELEETGYKYMDEGYTGDYVSMLIFPNPFNKWKKVLLIYTNNYKLLKKCFFTRKMIIPTFLNGMHPYLSGEAVLYNGRNYYIINEWGEKLTTP